MRYDLAAIVRRARPGWRPGVVAIRGVDLPVWSERELLAIMVQLLRGWDRAYRQIVARYSLPAPDTAAPVRDAPNETEAAIAAAEAEIGQLLLVLTPQFTDWVVRAEAEHRREFERIVKVATGVDLQTVVGLGPNAETLEVVLARLVNLVRGLNDDTRKALSEVIWRGFTQLTPRAKVAREIRGVMEASRKRAILIARDQTTKLAARLDQERQEEAGFRRYIWRHSRKLRPRLEHVARDGKLFEWKKPPYDGHPGYAINCGCKAEAYLELDDR